MGGWPSTTGNPSGGGRWNNEEDNGCDDNEETTGENVMGTQFMRVIGNKLINKSAIVEVIPSFSIVQEIVENPNHKGLWGNNEQVVKVDYKLDIDITTVNSTRYSVKLPKMKLSERHASDSYTYKKSYSGETIIDEENAERCFLYHNNDITGDVVYMTTDYFENNIESFSNEYALLIASRYMKSQFKS